MIVRALLSHPQLGLNPSGFMDDDPSKHGQRMYDMPVLGSLSAIKAIALAHEVDEVVIAMPRAPGATVRQVVGAALEAGVRPAPFPPCSTSSPVR
jgi:FlaA1/EpsC-like NDP-sugar epimerase